MRFQGNGTNVPSETVIEFDYLHIRNISNSSQYSSVNHTQP